MKKIFYLFTFLTLVKISAAQSEGGTVGGSVTVCSGTNSGILTLSGHTGNVVRWQSSTNSGATWTNITNATVNYVYANVSATTLYRAEVLLAPSPPNISAYSTPAIITVDVASSGIISSSASVCTGSNAGSLLLSGTFTSVNGWEFSTDGGITWTPIANTTTTLNYSNLTATTSYRASVTNGTCPASNATAATITVNPLSVGGSIAGYDTVCSSSNSGTLLLSGNIGNVIHWQYSEDGGASWSNVSNTTNIHNFSNIEKTTQYRAVVQSGNCLIENSSLATITVHPASVGGDISSAATVCSGVNTGTLVLDNYTGNITMWESSIDGGASWSPIINTTSNYTYNNLITTTSYRALVKSGICDSAYSAATTITTNPASIGGTVSGSDSVCSGSNSGILTLSGYSGSIVRWQSSTDGGISWSTISNTSSLQNYSNINSTTNYRAVVQNGTCPSDNSSSATIVVLPLSNGGSLSPASYAACSGSNSGIISLSSQSGNVIGWEYSTDGGISWNAISNTTLSHSFTNLITTTKYRVLVQNGQCAADYSSVSTINVSPPSAGGTILGSDTVCTGTNSGLLTLTGYTGSIQNWEYSVNNGVTWSNISSTANIHNYANLSTSTLYRAVVESGSCTAANSGIATVMVTPLSVGGTILSNNFVCDSAITGTLLLTGYTGSILQWEFSVDSGITWNAISNKNSSQIYSGITKETLYRVKVRSGNCPADSSSPAIISLAIPVVASYSTAVNGATAVYTNTSTGNNISSFWNFGDNTVSAIKSPAHTYTANGSYAVKLSVTDSCGGDTTTQTVIITGVGINELAYNNPDVSIYPNPFSETTILRITNGRITNYNLKIFDMIGKEMNIEFIRNSDSFVISRGNLAAGIYFYKLSTPSPLGEGRGEGEAEVIATGKIVIGR